MFEFTKVVHLLETHIMFFDRHILDAHFLLGVSLSLSLFVSAKLLIFINILQMSFFVIGR